MKFQLVDVIANYHSGPDSWSVHAEGLVDKNAPNEQPTSIYDKDEVIGTEADAIEDAKAKALLILGGKLSNIVTVIVNGNEHCTMHRPRTIQIPIADGYVHEKIEVKIGIDGSTAISCFQMEECPQCGNHFCFFDCDLSQVDNPESEDVARARIETNCRIDGVLTMIQNLFHKGVDIESQEFAMAVELSMDYIFFATRMMRV